MTHRESRDHSQTRKIARGFQSRLRDQRRRKERQLLSEALEPRQLLAGPDLIGVQPNLGSLINGGEILNVSPREIVFRFDDNTELDPATLSGIRITRSGEDGVFESATALSDLGTGGQAVVEFVARQTGALGNGIVVNFLTNSRVGSPLPLVSVNGRSVTIDVNENPSNPTRIQHIISAVADNAAANALIEVVSVSGSLQAPVGTTIVNNSSLVLDGANAAEAITDFGSNGAASVRIVSQLSGADGLETEINIQRRNFFGSTNPLVVVNGQSILVQLNSFPGDPSTAQDFIDAVNGNPDAAALIQVLPQSGDLSTPVGLGSAAVPTIHLTGITDVVIEPGFIGLGDSAREVIFRFAEPLPDDVYQIDIIGSGPSALLNTVGEPFGDGVNESRQFSINLGPRVVAVVPEPVRRNASGDLVPQAGIIEVHFNDDQMNPSDATNPNFYQLVFTRDTVTNTDDFIVTLAPGSVQYNSSTGIATLNYGRPLARIIDPVTGSEFTGAARLRIGTTDALPAPPVEITIPVDADDTFATATPIVIGSNTLNSVRLAGEIDNTTEYGLTQPGPDAPGVRNLRPDDPTRLFGGILDHLRGGPDNFDGISVAGYSFPPSWLGDDPSTDEYNETLTYFNVISEQQKERVREVMTMFSEYLGISFFEVEGDARSNPNVLSIAVGDLYGASGTGVSGEGGFVAATGFHELSPLVVMDFQDFDQSVDDQFGGDFFRGAMFAVGQLLGYGYAMDLPQPITQPPISGDIPISELDNEIEPSYPSYADILHGRYLFSPDSTDIDLYRFNLTQPGLLSLETQAERMADPSLLDTALRLYYEISPGEFVEVAQNDDYFSNDSLIRFEATQTGTYVVGVSARGNTSYDPNIDNSGFGGLTEGSYELIATFDPAINDVMTDTTNVALDGDGDGTPGGVFDFWFEPADPTDTIYVDKEAALGGTGTVSRPFQEIDLAIAEAIRRGNDNITIRIVGNGGVDGLIETVEDNFSYQIGSTSTGNALPDGRTLDLPKGVDLIIDAGAIIKFSGARIGIGSVSPTIDLSDASLQVLGTPSIITSTGAVARDQTGAIIPGSVYFTSINDSSIGNGNGLPFTPSPRAGDWGGIDFRGDLDFADESRRNREQEGVFLNHIQFADMRYGGGSVSVAGRQVVVSPIDMAVTRPTIINSRISHSADAAMGATPDTFTETNFNDPVYQGLVEFTPDYSRVGPSISGNTVVDNSINGLFIRTVTRTGDEIEKITASARFDDTDITHVLAENLIIQGTAGGAIVQTSAPSTILVVPTALPGGGSVPAGEYVYRLTNIDHDGLESAASLPTSSVTLGATGAIRLSRLPVPQVGGQIASRRLYRAVAGSDEFRLVATLNSNDTTFTDRAAAGTLRLSVDASALRTRLDASLVIDPGTVIKLDSARIEARLGAGLIAEGKPSLPIVFTSIEDQRYGAGGTFDTNDRGDAGEMNPGDWGGIYVGPAGSASIDHAVIAGGGGVTRIEGGFATFNAIEVHQGELRLANSRVEWNADGRGDPAGERVGRGENAAGAVFARAAHPIIVGNSFVSNESAALSIDINSFSAHEVNDPGRSTGDLEAVAVVGNAGPLLQNNLLDNNAINGVHVRGGMVATAVTLDDVDMVHVVTDAIEVPNQHVVGGLLLKSDARGSLVIKFESAENETAGIVVGGTFETATDEFVDIADRIGGSLQVVGHPDFPVVLTTLADDTAGAGFTLNGSPQVDTNNDGISGVDLANQDGRLPAGPEVNNGLLIDNDVDPQMPGFFNFMPGPGGEHVSAVTTTQGLTQIFQEQASLFDYGHFIDVGVDGGAIGLGTTTITLQPTLVSDDLVASEGNFQGENGQVNWRVETYFEDGGVDLVSVITLESDDPTQPLGDIRFINYYDPIIGSDAGDNLFTEGTPGEDDFRITILDAAEEIGFRQYGALEPGPGLIGATYEGWIADLFPQLITDPVFNLAFTPDGTIDTADIPAQNLPQFPFPNYGPGIITSAMAWVTDPEATSATFTTNLQVIAEVFGSSGVQAEPGLWEGIVIREGADDRNVAAIAEEEPSRTSVVDANDYVGDGNAIPGQAQFLGELAPDEKSGDENRRLGFVIDGVISTRSDLDVYGFIAESGTEVWLDIDRTSNQLDTVVELIDANGFVLAASNDSILAETNPNALFTLDGVINPGAVQPLSVVAERLPSQRIVLSESIYDATGGTIALKLNTSSTFVTVDVLDLQVAPAFAVSAALRTTFPELGNFTVTQLPSTNGNNLVLEMKLDANDFRGRSVPELQVDTLGVVGATVTGSVNLAFAKSELQDVYTTNEKDAGMRIILPGEVGTRNLYHIRVRSSNTLDPTNFSNPNVRGGLSSGAYQLQVRLGETDEFAGTQIRHADIRYAVDGLQIIGQPLHSPLTGEEYEIVGDNDTLAGAQTLGYFGAGNDQNVIEAGPLQSDRLAKSFAGELDSFTDVDWYRFEIDYENLIADQGTLLLSTVFDLDYASGFGRADMAFYVFNSAGELILAGGDSNISDDLPTSSQGSSSVDLSRGSAGTKDPYIGAAELREGTYFIAVSNQLQVPLPLDQFFNVDTANPLLRLEPIDSVIRIAEDRIGSFGGATAEAPTVPLLFDNNSIVPYSLDDVLLYVNTGTSLFLVNPFTGENYINDDLGNTLGQFGIEQGLNEVAFRANGELFAYTNNGPIPSDGATQYVRINASDATITTLGGLGVSTFHQNTDPVPDDGALDVSSNTGLQVNAISIASFGGNETGFFVANRFGATSGLQYSTNVLYSFDDETGLILGPTYDDPNQIDAGAGTSPRELGHIDVNAATSLTRLGISAASVRNNQGVIVPGLADGDTFTITSIGGGEVTFELEQGFTLVANELPVRDGDRVEVNGQIFEINSGTSLQLSEPVPTGNLAVGTTVQIGFGGTTRTFEFIGANTPVPGNIPVQLLNSDGSSRTAATVATNFTTEINSRFPGIGASPFNNEIFFAAEPSSLVIDGTGVVTVGDTLLNDPTAVEVAVAEMIAPDALTAVLETLFNTEGITTNRVGTQIVFPTAVSLDVDPINPNLETGLIEAGVPGVLAGNVQIDIDPGDSVDAVREAITNAINTAASNGSLAGVSVDEAGSTENSILIDGGTVTATGNLVGGGAAVGGTVVGIELVGNTLYALTDRGGLFTVPASRLNVPGSNGNNTNISQPVSTATDLASLNVNFTALRSGPDSVNGGSLQQILFGLTSAGEIYAFNLAGELQPIFAGGQSSISTGIGGAQGLDFSILDYNLWHVTNQRGEDEGHGIDPIHNGSRASQIGGNSLAFTFESSAFAGNYSAGERPVVTNSAGTILNPRQDGQLLEDTYNFPGGAHGVVESNPFSLVGYASADQPTLYFNYYLATEANNGSDALRVHVITPDGVEHLVATNNLFLDTGSRDDEFDDPTLFDGIDADVQQLYDTTNSINDTWRQARISLNDFAEMADLRLRIEFSTSGTTQTTSEGLRVVSGRQLAATSDRQFTIQSNTGGGGNQRFELEFVPTVAFPSGPQLADLYQNPAEVATIEIEGQTYVLDDGSRTIGAGQIAIDLLAGRPDGVTLSDLSGADVAAAVARVTLPLPGATEIISGVDFSGGEDVAGQVVRNDQLTTATPLPYSGGTASILGDGRLGTVNTNNNTVSNTDDVDMVQLTVTKDTLIEIDVQLLSTNVADPAIRFFDANGDELLTSIDAVTGTVRYTATQDGTIFIGISGAGNDFYDPNQIETLAPGDVDVDSSYSVVIDVKPLGAVGNSVEYDGATQPIVVAPADLFQVEQGSGDPNTIAIPVSRFMSANEVAIAVQKAIADRFGAGVLGSVPITGSSLQLGGLDIQDAGPFVAESDRYEFSDGPRSGTQQNEFEGVYLDDFIIGFAERGEIATGSNVVDTEFISDIRPQIPNPDDQINTLATGTYQVEIRDASEYIETNPFLLNSADDPIDERSLLSNFFRSFDTNEPLSSTIVVTARAATDIRDGSTFSINDGRQTIVFEFDLEESGPSVATGNVPVPFTLQFFDVETGITRPQTAAEVARSIVAAIQRSDVQSEMRVSAVIAAGADSTSSPRINVSGNVLVTDLGGALGSVFKGALRGDENRDRDAQGVIIVENSRFLYNAEHGIVISHGLTADVAGQTTQSVVRYQRNLVEQNTERIKPGVVIQSNVLAFNNVGGLQVNGINPGANDTASDPVPYDRIINNTIIGGNISQGRGAPAEEFSGVLYPLGAISFADAIVDYDPDFGGTAPAAIHQNANAALGIPDSVGFGAEPIDGDTAVSLGDGGRLTVQFTNNLLTGSGDAAPDLIIMETGMVESVRVEISRDGVNFIDVGIAGGLDNMINIDAFGFGSQDQFAFVRLTDLRQGSATSGPIGADIDAVGALSTVPVEVFSPSGTGVELTGNASPVLLNNIVSNSDVGLQMSATGNLAILGGNTFYRNTANAPGGISLGRDVQVLSNSEVVFFAASDLNFSPAAGAAIIDSSIDSLLDRDSLTSVKDPLGLAPSPIIAPRLDVSGQLRVDDPDVEPPSGLGERIFKDRGAADRGDQVGPRVVLLSPLAENLGLNAGVATVGIDGNAPQYFEVQLLDGLAPADAVPGTGIDDRTVTSNSVLLLKDGVLQVEGVDYRFGYNPSTNVIRVTPIAGVWEQDSTYVIRMVDSGDAIVQALEGSEYTDGDILRVADAAGDTTRFEFETGIVLTANALLNQTVDADGLVIEVFDGVSTLSFELDDDETSSGNNVPVEIDTTDGVTEISIALANAINASGLNITAFPTESGVQFLGSNPLSTVTSDSTAITVRGAIGTSIGFGLKVPNDGTQVDSSLSDGDSFTIRRGSGEPVTFEFDTNGSLVNEDAIRVAPTDIRDLDSVANALVLAISGTQLGLNPINAGFGRVQFQDSDVSYSVDPGESTIQVLGTPGQGPTVPIVIDIRKADTEIVQDIADAITDEGLPGVTATVFGSRILLDGTNGISGVGAVNTVIISDQVGNQVQANLANGRTELTIFVGSGFDYGDAPYESSSGDNPVRHGVDSTFALAPVGSATTVSADSEARLIDADDDNGISIVGDLEPGFASSLIVNVTNASGEPFQINGWFDWNANGVFESNELDVTISSVQFGSAAQGQLILPLQVPSDAVVGETYSRFRLFRPSENPVVGPAGDAVSGEVEDYRMIIGNNPYQNPNPIFVGGANVGRYDVNNSGFVSAIDALQIINTLRRNGGTNGIIDLSDIPVPSDLPAYPDVNGDGRVTSLDALNVINKLAELQASGEAGLPSVDVASTFVSAGDGVLASATTVVADQWIQRSDRDRNESQEPVSTVVAAVEKTSVFDQAAVMELDSVVDSLAADKLQADAVDSDGPNAVDQIFASL